MTGQGKHQKVTVSHFDISFSDIEILKTFLFLFLNAPGLLILVRHEPILRPHYQEINVFEYDFTVKGFQSMIIIFHCLLTRIYISKVIVGYRTLILSMRPLNLMNFLEGTCSLRNKIYP